MQPRHPDCLWLRCAFQSWQGEIAWPVDTGDGARQAARCSTAYLPLAAVFSAEYSTGTQEYPVDSLRTWPSPGNG